MAHEAAALARAIEAARFQAYAGKTPDGTSYVFARDAGIYPSSHPTDVNAWIGLAMRSLAALGYDLNPAYYSKDSLLGPAWTLDLSGYKRDVADGPEILPLLNAALIAHGLKLGETA